MVIFGGNVSDGGFIMIYFGICFLYLKRKIIFAYYKVYGD